MNDKYRHYDVAIVGAGPVGSVCALAHAQQGARVALFEANPKASQRLAGEWLHPPAIRALRSLGIEIEKGVNHTVGKGFAVIPEDGSRAMVLPYQSGTNGLACEHSHLVACLHSKVEQRSDIDFFMPARVRSVEEGRLVFNNRGVDESLSVSRIIGADGRSSVVRKSLGLQPQRLTCSRMIGVEVNHTELPFEGYGHIFLGAPGPVLIYQLAPNRIRIIADVPLNFWIPKSRVSLLADSYANVLPDELREAFLETLKGGNFCVANNELRPRTTNGDPRRVLIGDAAGNYHPMTAIGMTIGFGDAIDLAKSANFRKYKIQRLMASRGPELLAMGLYEVFADHRLESVELRRSIYRNWRAHRSMRQQTMKLLACEHTSVTRLALAFTATVAQTLLRQIPKTFNQSTRQRVNYIYAAIAVRLTWLVRGILIQRKNRKPHGKFDIAARNSLSRALLTSLPPVESPIKETPNKIDVPDVSHSLDIATWHLLSLQNEDGSWEGEMVWCPMLTAQYVLLHHIIGKNLSAERRRLILVNFEKTRLHDGLWGFHEHASPSLFVTTLVYVATRLLGVNLDDELVAPARQFLHNEDVTYIPSWGKFWLAVLNLYDWRGLHAVLPELWGLPRHLALHPSNWYCHTRLIYMAMATVYSTQHQVPVTPIIESLREELYPQGYDAVPFTACRNRLHSSDVFARPSLSLRAAYAICRIYQRVHSKDYRKRVVTDLTERIRWELNSSSHTSISPVSGQLNLLALWLANENDRDLKQGLEKLEGWIFEDEANGTRLTGARSASWDTSFALQTLSTLVPSSEVTEALHRGATFLRDNQITDSFEGYQQAYRNDPQGGWCFAGGWHGWPVTDCTAEAILGLTAVHGSGTDVDIVNSAIHFMRRGQNRDGGFGSYEARRTRVKLDWFNPSEMFAESMTETSFVECTASCLSAFAACCHHFPDSKSPDIDKAIERGEKWLRKVQQSDGSWRGVWGIQYIYGTLFGIRGLLAAGAKQSDPALRIACQWLIEQQRPDGGWGEHHSGCISGKYVQHTESQVIQTAWAMIALLEANAADWQAISAGARFLVDSQNVDGTWPRQDMAGVFFRTALLEYVLYRQYFPLHALSLYDRRRKAHESFVESESSSCEDEVT